MRLLAQCISTVFFLAFSITALASEVTVNHLVVKKSPQTPGGYCPFCVSISAEVGVQNLAFTKDVVLHYSVNGGAWNSVSGSFDRSLSADSEIWGLRAGTGFISGGVADIEIAVEYRVGGQSYWANNAGQNFQLSVIGDFSGVYLDESHVISKNQKIVYNSFRGEVYIRNLAFEKTINVVYSYDGWQTVLVGAATFDHLSTDSDFEAWSFNLEVPAGTESVEYAIAYDVAGTTYWANNHGSNYTALRASF